MSRESEYFAPQVTVFGERFRALIKSRSFAIQRATGFVKSQDATFSPETQSSRTNMKLAKGLWIGSVVSSCLVWQAAGAIVVGTGADSSFLVVESPNVGMRTYEVFFDFEAANPLGTDDLLALVDSADALISFAFGGSPDNQFLSSVSFGGSSEAFDGTNFWAQWVAGGQAGVGPAPDFAPQPAPIPSESWTFGSGVSAPFRIVEPGATDVISFSDGSVPPNFAPIPEPSATVLVVGGLLLGLARRKR